MCLPRQWWEQDVLYLGRAKERTVAESDGEESQSEEEGLAKEETAGCE